jgi:hypothetical protein
MGFLVTLVVCFMFPSDLPDVARGPYRVGVSAHHVRAPDISVDIIPRDAEFMVQVKACAQRLRAQGQLG